MDLAVFILLFSMLLLSINTTFISIEQRIATENGKSGISQFQNRVQRSWSSKPRPGGHARGNSFAWSRHISRAIIDVGISGLHHAPPYDMISLAS